MADSNDFARLVELLPWYVKGVLPDADRAWVDTYLATHPEAKTELDWYRTMNAEIIDGAPPVPANVGWEGSLQRIRRDQARVVPSVSAWQKIVTWFAASGAGTSRPRFAPTMLAMAVAVILQAVALGWLALKSGEPPYSEVRSGDKGWADGPLLRVNFAADAKESEIRLILVEAHALIIAGPTALGDFYLKTAPGKLDKVAAQLATSPLVKTINKVPSLPQELLEE